MRRLTSASTGQYRSVALPVRPAPLLRHDVALDMKLFPSKLALTIVSERKS
jgi:hypothetical protein